MELHAAILVTPGYIHSITQGCKGYIRLHMVALGYTGIHKVHRVIY